MRNSVPGAHQHATGLFSFTSTSC